MGIRNTANQAMLLVLAAAVGVVLVMAPPQLVAQYQAVKEWGTPWIAAYFAVVGSGAALLIGSIGWIVARIWRATRRKRLQRQRQARNPNELSLAEREQETNENLAIAADLQSDPAVNATLRERLQALTRRVESKRENQELELVAFGSISSGKSSLLNALAGRDVFVTDPKGGTTVHRNSIPWPGQDRVTLVDTPGLGEIEGFDRVSVAASAAKDADLVLLVVDGPLRDSEFRLLEHFGRMEKRVLVCVNKQDWYSERDRAALREQLLEQLRDVVKPEDVVSVQSQATKRARIRQLPDGQEVEEIVEVPPDIRGLAERMLRVIQHDGHDLLLANLLLQSRGLVSESKRQVKAALEGEARRIVDRYTWSAGAAAALSPLPLVDLVAGGALTTKMVLDLARVYRQDMDANAVVNLLGQLGKNLLAILGASAASPIVASLVASLLKTVPGAGTLAGGALQGIVQALVTRWVGSVFIEYFQNEMQTPPGGLAELARLEWQRLTTVSALRAFVQSARQRLFSTHEDDDEPTNRRGASTDSSA